MCGIAGFVDPRRRCDPLGYDAIAAAMAGQLAHRGPDDQGVWSDAEAGIALGFRRLSIVDLSHSGHQPMLSANGRLVMVFNGEIYNHHALRESLTAAGVGPWRGHSDSEVLLAAIAHWGFVAALDRLDGMFAIAVWDRRDRRLWLARDRFGEKPLYYGWLDGVLIFGSELKALQRHPAWRGEINRDALALSLRFGYVPGPLSAFTGIGKLASGGYASFAAGAADEGRFYWLASERAAAAAAQPFIGDLADAGDRLQALIDASVRLRRQADVPLGVFLSGGIDSSLVAAAMQRAHGGVRSFNIAFPDPRFDESGHAKAVAHHLGTDHSTLVVDESDCLAVLPRLAEIYDEPFADASQIPTAVLCRLTRQHVTVALSGDGGDELFGGYPRYTAAAAAWWGMAAHPALRATARWAASRMAGRHGKWWRRLRKRADAWGHDTPASLYRDYVSWWKPRDNIAALTPATAFDVPLSSGQPSLEQSFMLLDAMTYLPDDLLVKIDRASMAVGLEVRAPLLDHHIAEFAWSLPPQLMLGGSKGVLREVLYRRVPRALVDRPKHGFEPPIGRWLREGLRNWADDLLSPARLARHGLVDPSAVVPRWREHRDGQRNWAYSLWTVLMVEAWLDERERAPARARNIVARNL